MVISICSALVQICSGSIVHAVEIPNLHVWLLPLSKMHRLGSFTLYRPSLEDLNFSCQESSSLDLHHLSLKKKLFFLVLVETVLIILEYIFFPCVVWIEFELLTSGLKSCVLPVFALSNAIFYTHFTQIDMTCFYCFFLKKKK